MTKLTPAPNGYAIKLVRDRTPEILNASGVPGELWYGPCPDGMDKYFLKLKLAEEVAEFLLNGGSDELSDVYAVLMGLGKVLGVDLAAIAAADERGGFEECVMMFGLHDEFDRRPT